MGAFVMGIVVGLILAITAYLIGSMWRSIRAENKKHPQDTWKGFGLSLPYAFSSSPAGWPTEQPNGRSLPTNRGTTIGR
jgi:hypothetical protein